MDDLFLLPGANPHDAAVEAWFAQGDPLRALVEPWFARLRGCGPDVTEILHDGHPTACVGDAAFAYVGAFATHASIGFFHGASLADPAGLLEGGGKRMRHVKLRWDRQPDSVALEALIISAYRDIRRRLGEAENG
jgi:hypothetical protein